MVTTLLKTPKPTPIIVPPPHTASEIVFQSKTSGNYLLLNTTEHTYFWNQSGDANDYGGTYSESSQAYNLNGDFGITTVFVKGDNFVSFYNTETKQKIVYEKV